MLKLAQSKVRFCVCSCCFACVHICSFLFRNKIVHPLFLYACFICCSHAVSVNFKNEMAFLFVNGCRGKFWPVSRLLEWEQVPSQSLTHTLTHTCTALLILRPIFQQICLYKWDLSFSSETFLFRFSCEWSLFLDHLFWFLKWSWKRGYPVTWKKSGLLCWQYWTVNGPHDRLHPL